LRIPDGADPTGQHGAFERVFAAFDADLGVVNFDDIDERLQISASSRRCWGYDKLDTTARDTRVTTGNPTMPSG